MKNVNRFLDDAKAITGSDYKTAKALEISRQGISTMRERGTMSNESAARLAALLMVDLTEIIAVCEIAKHPEKKAFWAKWVAATVIMSVIFIAKYTDDSTAYAASSISRAIYYAHKWICDRVREAVRKIRLIALNFRHLAYG
jgi:hypothetical protein